MSAETDKPDEDSYLDESIPDEEFSDPLLECLVLITQMHHQPYSADALRAGLPLVDNKFTPDLFARAADQAGFSTRLVKRRLNGISSLVLPAVLILKDNQACILTGISKRGDADVIFPEMSDSVTNVKIKELAQQYAGYAFLIKPIHDFESRTESEEVSVSKRNWFWGTLWRFKRYYFQVILASFLINVFALATPLFVMNVYDRVVPNAAIETLWVLAIGVIIVFIFDFIVRTLRGYFIDFAGKKVDVILAGTLFQQALGIQLKARPPSTGVQANHLRDFENVRDFFTSATIATLADLPFVLLFIWIISLIGGPLALIPLAVIPVVILVAIIISVPLNRAVAKSFVGSAQKHAILIESLNNLDVIKSVSGEGTMLSRWEDYVRISSSAMLRSRFFSNLATNFSTIAQYVVTVSVVVGGVYLIDQHKLSVGGLIACTILAGRTMAPLGQITGLLTRYQLAKLSLKALNKVMDLPIERPRRKKFLHRSTFEGNIEFENVSFKYADQGTELFRDISFSIKAGERVGILGSMGSGKSTLQKLLMSFYAPDEGAIRIDGTDMAQIDPADLRRHIGYVAQTPQLFFGTVRENIAMKAPWSDDSAILEAAKISGADSFISKHPAGYDMPIGENGLGLSGGQCQSITIARSLLLSPSILLFDEPTTSMDNATEKMFLERMEEYVKGKTLLLVTHKMSILSIVDRLIVFQNGKIIADGEKDRVLDALVQLNKPGESEDGDTTL